VRKRASETTIYSQYLPDNNLHSPPSARSARAPDRINDVRRAKWKLQIDPNHFIIQPKDQRMSQ